MVKRTLSKLLKSKIFWVQILSLITGIFTFLNTEMLSQLGITNFEVVYIIIGIINTALTTILRSIQGTDLDFTLNK